MNPNVLTNEVQAYISENVDTDANKIALGKSPFINVSSLELATQIAAKKKSKQKLQTWFNTANIYYPPALSIEQTSSEATAYYKSTLTKGNVLVDLTAGFGIDSYYFAKAVQEVYSCEINLELSAISAHNVKVLGATNVNCLATDGLAFIAAATIPFDTIYVDPARRSSSGKVFKLADCTPNIVDHLDLMLQKAQRIIIKTSPLLDISAGLAELKNVSEIHIISVKNECKELLWIVDSEFDGKTKIVCATINENLKTFSFPIAALKATADILQGEIKNYLYEPDVALMKSGAFNWISKNFNLTKLENQTQLYIAENINSTFPGRIFEIKNVTTINELKKIKLLKGNVIVRNFPHKAESLVKKYKIASSKDDFIIFTKNNNGYAVIFATIVQYY